MHTNTTEYSITLSNLTSSCYANCCPKPGNCTPEILENEHCLHMWPYIGYLIQGLIFGIANLLVFLSILRHPILRQRKEYFIVSALAFADVIHEFSFIVGGIERIQMTSSLEYKEAVACRYPYYCITTAHGFLWNLSFPLVYFMLLCISIDRFLFVLRPLLYKSLSIRYSYGMALLFYCLALTESILRVIASKMTTDSQIRRGMCPSVEGLCLLDHAFGEMTFFISLSMQLACSFASVVLYACIPSIYKRQERRLTILGQFGHAELIFLQEQRRMLITLGICSIFTFVLMVLPTSLRIILYFFPPEAFPWAALIMNFNPIVNTFLFMFRHRQFRESFICLLKCKSVTINTITSSQSGLFDEFLESEPYPHSQNP